MKVLTTNVLKVEGPADEEGIHMQVEHMVAKVSGLTFDLVVKELRKRSFGVLGTVTKDGRPHSVGIAYGVSLPGAPFEIYVMTRRHLQKARNIAANPNVSLVVPLTRRLLWFLPPPCIQLQGQAEILDRKDETGTKAFEAFFMGRQILGKYEESYRRGETRTCFLRITPGPEIFTYMVGYPVWEMSKRMESGSGMVEIPIDRRGAALRRS